LEIIREIFNAILEGQHIETAQKVEAGLAAGLEPKQILDEGLIAATAEVGRLFERGEYYVPEMLVAARPCRPVWFF
jgi:5-methyltetrahydrofolate--homocysteine methyltransferase